MRQVEESRSRGVGTAGRGDAGVARVLKTNITAELAREHSIDPEMVEIRPEPSPPERAAILIALEQMLSKPRPGEAPRLAAWAQAGRQESLLGNGAGPRSGWGRDSDRLAGR